MDRSGYLEELKNILFKLDFKRFEFIKDDNTTILEIDKEVNIYDQELKEKIYNSKNRIECWQKKYNNEYDRLILNSFLESLENFKVKENYKTHCWKCGNQLSSDINKTCIKCGYLKCPHCGACFCVANTEFVSSIELRKFEEYIKEEKNEVLPKLNTKKNLVLSIRYYLRKLKQ